MIWFIFVNTGIGSLMSLWCMYIMSLQIMTGFNCTQPTYNLDTHDRVLLDDLIQEGDIIH